MPEVSIPFEVTGGSYMTLTLTVENEIPVTEQDLSVILRNDAVAGTVLREIRRRADLRGET